MSDKTLTGKGIEKTHWIANPLGKRLYTLKEGAVYLGRSVYSMRELVWNQEIPVVKGESARKIFLDIMDLDEYINKNKSLYV